MLVPLRCPELSRKVYKGAITALYMEKKTIIIRQFLKLLERFAREGDAAQQQLIAEEIADYASSVNDVVERDFDGEFIHDIQKMCLVMHSWGQWGNQDRGLTRHLIDRFVERLRRELDES